MADVVDGRDEVTKEDALRLFDFSRVHCIRPQRGGGNEPIGARTIDMDLRRFFAIDSDEEWSQQGLGDDSILARA